MALPLLFGLLGSGLAASGSGAIASFLGGNALLGGALGTGLGRFIESGDLGEGIKAGLGSYVGGSLLGSVAGGMGGKMATPLPGQSTIGTGAGAMTTGPTLGVPAGGMGELMPPALPPYSMAKDVFTQGMKFGSSAQGLGAAMGSVLASPPKAPTYTPEAPPDISKVRPMDRTVRTPGADYRPGISGEFDYGVSDPYTSEYFRKLRGYAAGGTVTKMVPGYGAVRMQAGGIANLVADQGGAEQEVEISPDDGGIEVETERMAGGNEKTVIVEAIKAIKGMSADPRMALGAFLAQYGEDALRDLVDRVQSGEFDETLQRFQNGENGIVRGPGDGSGTDDKVPATIDGEQDVLLSDGEFVTRKDATDALEAEFGDGFMDRVNDAGPNAPKVMRQMVA